MKALTIGKRTLHAFSKHNVMQLSAAGLFGQLQNALKAIWSVQPKAGRGIKGMLQDRFLSLAMVFGICFLLLISMILSTIIAASSAALGHKLGVPDWIGHVVTWDAPAHRRRTARREASSSS